MGWKVRQLRLVRTPAEARWAIESGVAAIYPKQLEIYQSKSLYRLFRGGRGAGKSRIGVEMALLRSGRRKCTGMVVAPTYKDLEDIILPAFMEVSRGVLRSYAKSRRVADLQNGSRILFRSGEDPQGLRGPNLSWFWMDEMCQQTEEVWDILLPSLRENGEMGCAWGTTTPFGHDWVYQLFDKPGDSDYFVVTARMEDNPFTSDEFKKAVRAKAGTSWKARQELDGEICEAEGPHFARSYFVVREPPAEFRYEVRGWDLAFSVKTGRDWSAGVKIGKSHDGQMWVTDVIRCQREWPRMRELIHFTAKRDGYGCTQVVETPGAQLALGQELRETLLGYGVRFVPRIKDKVTYALPIATALESNNLYLAPGPWNERYIDEFVAFDGLGKHPDDQVDATSNAFSSMVRVEPGIEVIRSVV